MFSFAIGLMGALGAKLAYYGAGSKLLTETGDFLVAEDGSYLILE